MEPRGARVYGMQGFTSLGAGAGRAADTALREFGEDRLDAKQVRPFATILKRTSVMISAR